ncbi:hypothetical protein DdX_06763 [Ditylenchus destructor]|uniref:Uncharacterized protein n=1 Tax=Ditylenchus destructor TaxID=166010 RepID=A0AAD4N9Y3_9BILA|nr:hypothetical protein DdX_06763 [Ditylenchus destructor]
MASKSENLPNTSLDPNELAHSHDMPHGNENGQGDEVQLIPDDSPLSSSSNSEGHRRQSATVEDNSSDVELLMASEEEQDVNLSFKRPSASAQVVTGHGNPQIAVQQLAKTQLNTKSTGSTPTGSDLEKGGKSAKPDSVKDRKPQRKDVEEFIPVVRTTMLTKNEVVLNPDEELMDVVNEDTERERERRFWRNVTLGVCGAVGVALVIGWHLKRNRAPPKSHFF